MGWTAADVARYLGIPGGSLDELRLKGSFPHPEWTRGGRQLWRPSEVRLWAATHIEMLRQRDRSSDADRLET
jgi:hypothetical protein